MAPGKPPGTLFARGKTGRTSSPRVSIPPLRLSFPLYDELSGGGCLLGGRGEVQHACSSHRRGGCGSPPSDRPPPPRSSATSGPERRLISDMRGLRVHRCVGRLFVAGCAPSAHTLPTAAPPVEDRALTRLVELLDEDLGSPVSLFCVSEVGGGGSNVRYRGKRIVPLL